MDQAKVRRISSLVPELLDVGSILHLAEYNSDNRHRLVTLFLYMVAELSALQQIINALTGLNGLPAVIVQCAVTTIYTCEICS